LRSGRAVRAGQAVPCRGPASRPASGREDALRQIVRAELRGLSDYISEDPLGNLHAVIKQKARSGRRIMLAAPMDEVGLQISHVDENGFLRFAPLGPLDPLHCVGARVRFADGRLGVIGLEPRSEASALPTVRQLFIDVGAIDRESSTFKPGEAAVFDRPLAEIDGRLVGKALGGRTAVAVLLETLRHLKRTPHEVQFVFSVQEEVGLRGATTAAYGLDPDIGIAVDVTEQKNLVEKTVAADMRLRDAVENISEAFVLWDAESRLVLCNSKYQQLHGLPEEMTAPGTAYEDVLSVGRQPIARTALKSDGKPEEGARSYEAQLADGRWLKISERRTKDGGLVSVGTEITQIKRHEERLMESERQKMATIADLRRSQQTLEYQAQQLAELAQKYAEEKTRAENASQSKSDFLANMSHELRTPLNAIIGFSEIMESGMFGPLGSEKYTEYCEDIRESGRYLLDVINDILDMSKIEAGRVRLQFEDVRLDELVAETMRVMSVKADEKQLKVESEIATGMAMRGDRRALKQILLNLLSNAIKFTQEGGRIVVRARISRNSALLLIEDSGIGIPRVALQKLGRPFEQVESQFTKTHKGSGLGLAIARSLAELHGGAMRIRSVEGIGTAVIIRLPLEVRKQLAA